MKKLSSAKLDFHSVDYYIKHNTNNETLKRISTIKCIYSERKWLVRISIDINWNLPWSSPLDWVIPMNLRAVSDRYQMKCAA
jgi:hypothetical protein